MCNKNIKKNNIYFNLLLYFFSFLLFPQYIFASESFEIDVKGNPPTYLESSTFLKRVVGWNHNGYVVYCADEYKNFSGRATFKCRDYDRGNSKELKKILKESYGSGYIYSDSLMYNSEFQHAYVDTQYKIWGAIKSTPTPEDSPSYIEIKGDNKLKVELDDLDYYRSSALRIYGSSKSNKISVQLYDEKNNPVDGAFITKNKYGKENSKINIIESNTAFFVKIPYEKIYSNKYKIKLHVSSMVPIDTSKLFICTITTESLVSKTQELLLYEDGNTDEIVNVDMDLKPVITFKKCSPNFSTSKASTCNGILDFSSDCNHLTVINNANRVLSDVEIHQTGVISNIITPTNVFAGGGFSLGILYTNNIKWNYLKNVPSYHSIIVNEMKNRIKSNQEFLESINISNVKLNGKEYKDMVKSCWYSTDNLDYYGENGITFTCLFTFPKYNLNNNGTVEKSLTNSINISNKYYLPLNFSGTYPIDFQISGLNRLKDNAIEKDTFKKSSDNIRWTDNNQNDLWFGKYNCFLDVYSLLYNNGKKNFIYRPIDLNNPFPNRIPGANWIDWYNLDVNKNRLITTYNNGNLEYISNFSKDDDSLKKIRDYNSSVNYLDWSTIHNGRNSFIDENDNIIRK